MEIYICQTCGHILHSHKQLCDSCNSVCTGNVIALDAQTIKRAVRTFSGDPKRAAETLKVVFDEEQKTANSVTYAASPAIFKFNTRVWGGAKGEGSESPEEESGMFGPATSYGHDLTEAKAAASVFDDAAPQYSLEESAEADPVSAVLDYVTKYLSDDFNDSSYQPENTGASSPAYYLEDLHAEPDSPGVPNEIEGDRQEFSAAGNGQAELQQSEDFVSADAMRWALQHGAGELAQTHGSYDGVAEQADFAATEERAQVEPAVGFLSTDPGSFENAPNDTQQESNLANEAADYPRQQPHAFFDQAEASEIEADIIQASPEPSSEATELKGWNDSARSFASGPLASESNSMPAQEAAERQTENLFQRASLSLSSEANPENVLSGEAKSADADALNPVIEPSYKDEDILRTIEDSDAQASTAIETEALNPESAPAQVQDAALKFGAQEPVDKGQFTRKGSTLLNPAKTSKPISSNTKVIVAISVITFVILLPAGLILLISGVKNPASQNSSAAQQGSKDKSASSLFNKSEQGPVAQSPAGSMMPAQVPAGQSPPASMLPAQVLAGQSPPASMLSAQLPSAQSPAGSMMPAQVPAGQSPPASMLSAQLPSGQSNISKNSDSATTDAVSSGDSSLPQAAVLPPIASSSPGPNSSAKAAAADPARELPATPLQANPKPISTSAAGQGLVVGPTDNAGAAIKKNSFSAAEQSLAGKWEYVYESSGGATGYGVINIKPNGSKFRGYGQDTHGNFQIRGIRQKDIVSFDKLYVRDGKAISKMIVYSGKLSIIKDKGSDFFVMTGIWRYSGPDKNGNLSTLSGPFEGRMPLR